MNSIQSLEQVNVVVGVPSLLKGPRYAHAWFQGGGIVVCRICSEVTIGKLVFGRRLVQYGLCNFDAVVRFHILFSIIVVDGHPDVDEATRLWAVASNRLVSHVVPIPRKRLACTLVRMNAEAQIETRIVGRIVGSPGVH